MTLASMQACTTFRMRLEQSGGVKPERKPNGKGSRTQHQGEVRVGKVNSVKLRQKRREAEHPKSTDTGKTGQSLWNVFATRKHTESPA